MIKVLVVEDEDLAAQRLQELIRETAPDIEIVGRTSSIEETVRFLKAQEVDLMFLDINLSDGYSFSIFEKSEYKTPPIIFTTAYSQYAIKAFELNSISYLLKPIKVEALQLAIEKYRHLSEANKERLDEDYSKLIEDFLKPYKERFLVKVNNKLETVSVADISYFYSEDKLTFIMLHTGRYVPIEFSLKALEDKLDPAQFYRVNRKYLVHINSIKEMYYLSKSKIKIELNPPNKNDKELNFVAVEKIGKFKKWLSF